MILACAGSAFLHGLLEPMPDHSSVLADFPVQLETLLQTKIHRRAILTASSVFSSFGDESRATGNSVPFFTTNEALNIPWVGLMLVISAMTMTVGNVTAIGQSSVKRLLAFSSIGHVGLMILGVVTLNGEGVRAILFYGIVYMFMTLIAFYITSHLSDMYGSDSHDVFKGLIYKHPTMAIIMAGVLFSLAGMPPFSGFVAKFNIFSVVIEKKLYGIAIVAAINSVIALYYYMKLAKTMIFGQADGEVKVLGFTPANQAVIIALFIPVLFLGIFWEKVMIISGNAVLFIK